MKLNEDGEIKSILLEKAIFKKAIALCMATAIGLLLLDLFYFEDYPSVVVEAFGTLALTVFLLISQNEKFLPKLILPFVIYMFLTLNLGWYFGGGFNTGIVLLYLLGIYVSLVIVRKEYRMALIMAVAMNLVFMILLEYNNQSIREFLKGTQEEIIASHILITLSFSLGIFLLYYVKNKFEEARRFTFEQNRILNAQAHQLMSLNEELSAINENLESMVKEKTKTIEEHNRKLLGFAASNLEKVSDPVHEIIQLSSEYETVGSRDDLVKMVKKLKRTAKVLDMEVREMNQKLERGDVE